MGKNQLKIQPMVTIDTNNYKLPSSTTQKINIIDLEHCIYCLFNYK